MTEGLDKYELAQVVCGGYGTAIKRSSEIFLCLPNTEPSLLRKKEARKAFMEHLPTHHEDYEEGDTGWWREYWRPRKRGKSRNVLVITVT